jgi:hypothetical protein
LFEHLDACPTIKNIEVKSTNFIDKDALFARLSQRPGLEGIEIDLDPGLALLPLLSGPSALPSPFSALKRAWIMCYPEVALALPVHLRLVEELQLDIARIPNQPVVESDFDILNDLLAQMSYCPHLRSLKVGVAMLATSFPSYTSLPKLTGQSLVNLTRSCQKLEDINFLTADPSAIDSSSITSEDFDAFCRALPQLRILNLKLHPATTAALEGTALLSLGQHCTELEVLRLKVPAHLPALPVSNTVPQILLNGETSPGLSYPAELPQATRDAFNASDAEASSMRSSLAMSSKSASITPLFPRLKHLAVARPETALAPVTDDAPVTSPDVSTSSHSVHSASDIIDPDLEESLVRTWAHPLLSHFPCLEILEAWGDWTGQDDELLNYFLPMSEILASTWEFLSGVEQDLWEDDDDIGSEVELGDVWRQSWESSEDWEKASLMNEFAPEHGVDRIIADVKNLGVYDEEPEGMMTPGRTVREEQLLREADTHGRSDQ